MKTAPGFSITTLILALTVAGIGCNVLDELTDSESTSGPVNRAARRSNVECYDTFLKFPLAK